LLHGGKSGIHIPDLVIMDSGLLALLGAGMTALELPTQFAT
jgi:hypothetical protein